MAKVTGLGKPPSILGTDPIAIEYYNELLQAAKLANTATQSDKLAAVFAAHQYSIYERALYSLYDPITGVLDIEIEQIGDKGQVRRIVNPAVSVMDQAHKRLTDLLKEFGLTPKARKAVEQIEAETSSLLHTLLSRVKDD